MSSPALICVAQTKSINRKLLNTTKWQLASTGCHFKKSHRPFTRDVFVEWQTLAVVRQVCHLAAYYISFVINKFIQVSRRTDIMLCMQRCMSAANANAKCCSSHWLVVAISHQFEWPSFDRLLLFDSGQCSQTHMFRRTANRFININTFRWFHHLRTPRTTSGMPSSPPPLHTPSLKQEVTSDTWHSEHFGNMPTP